MANNEEKQKFIRHLSDSTGFSTDDIDALRYGRVPDHYGERHIKLIQALAVGGEGIIVGLIWKAQGNPAYLRNSPLMTTSCSRKYAWIYPHRK